MTRKLTEVEQFYIKGNRDMAPAAIAESLPGVGIKTVQAYLSKLPPVERDVNVRVPAADVTVNAQEENKPDAQQMHEINQMINHQGDISRDYLNDKNIILISDGLATGTIVDAALAFLKPVRTKSIVAAIPFASVAVGHEIYDIDD